MTFQSLKENNPPQIWIQKMKIVDYLMISATIRIGQDILCLPYAFFFLDVINFRIVTHFWLCLLETQVVGEVNLLSKFWLLALTVWY